MNRLLTCGAASLALHTGLLTAGGWGGGRVPRAVEVTGGLTSVALVVYAPGRVSALDPSDPTLPHDSAARPPRAPSVSVRLEGAEQAAPRHARNQSPPYPLAAFVHRQQGRVELLVHVDEQGRSQRVVVERSSGSPFLDEAARTAVLGWVFVPARRGARPVTSVCRVPIHFRLEDAP